MRPAVRKPSGPADDRSTHSARLECDLRYPTPFRVRLRLRSQNAWTNPGSLARSRRVGSSRFSMEQKLAESADTSSPQRTPRISAREFKVRMEGVERLVALFRFERMVHLGVTSLSLLMLLTSAAVLVARGAGPAELTGLLGSSGLIAYSASRLLVMWNQALRLLSGESTRRRSTTDVVFRGIWTDVGC